jgi:hypothetical protein
LKQHFLKYSTTLFLEAISQEIQPVIDVMLRVESLDLHDLLRKAIADINIHRIELLLAHSEIKAMIEHHQLEYFHIALTTQSELLLGLLLKHFKLNDQAFTQLLDFNLHQQNPRLLLAFLKFEDNFRRVDVLGLLKVLSQEPDYLQFLLRDSNIQKILSHESKACFIEALKHNNFAAIDTMMRQPCTREELKKIDASDILAFQAHPSWPVVYAKWQQDREFSFFTHRAFLMVRHIASLPPLIQLAFNTCLAGVPNYSLFLIGSAVHRLIQGLPVETLEDFDFVSNQPPRTDEISGFRQDRRIHPLFRRALTSDIRIEYYVAPHHSRYFILDDYSRRDFTVNALYCSRHGEIFDPTGRGIDDLNHRVIRSIRQPDIAFHNNPILLLRAIRLIAKGFTPDHDVHFAMLSWSPVGPINYGHIFAMAKTMLKSSLGISVFMILNEYQLLSKLLNFIWEPIFENVLNFVEMTSDMYNSSNSR